MTMNDISLSSSDSSFSLIDECSCASPWESTDRRDATEPFKLRVITDKGNDVDAGLI
jgi:hypothetical protein